MPARAHTERQSAREDNSNVNIPKTFAAMARFNAAVMGTGDRASQKSGLSDLGLRKEKWPSQQGNIRILSNPAKTGALG